MTPSSLLPAHTKLRFPGGGVALAVVLVLVSWVAFPPFHLVSTRAPGAGDGSFDAPAFAASFWKERLLPAASKSADATAILRAVHSDPKLAMDKFGLRVGLGNAVYFFAQGSGRVVAIERNRLVLDCDGFRVAVRTGPVFGNAVRDGSGLLEVNQVPGLSEFNAISSELNRMVEEKVHPVLQHEAVLGALVFFAGCAEAPEIAPASGAPLLVFVPVKAEVRL